MRTFELKRIGGSLFVKLPTDLIDDLKLRNDNKILANIYKYEDTKLKDLHEAMTTGKTINIKHCGKIYTGVVTFIDRETITFMSGGYFYILKIEDIKFEDLSSQNCPKPSGALVSRGGV